MRKAAAAGGLGALPLLLAACGGSQSTLAPESNASHEIADLWWVMMTGAWVLFGVVVMLLVVALLRRRGRPGAPPTRGLSRRDEGSRRLVLLGGVVAPILVLSALFAAGIRTLPATSAPAPGRAALTVVVTGHQWFWEARYPASGAVTANEIHIPVGVPVRLEVETADVIHSFWVPRLNRKIDTIPGRRNAVLLEADRPGVYRGQCAEYCGLQHANMAFAVYAEPPQRFRRWLADQAAPARTPRGAEARRGLDVFLTQGCAACHTIRGTSATASVGPDLTHLATRSTLAALTIPNRPGDLAGWIRDPQQVKPGNEMPGLDLSGDQLRALVAYLTGLR